MFSHIDYARVATVLLIHAMVLWFVALLVPQNLSIGFTSMSVLIFLGLGIFYRLYLREQYISTLFGVVAISNVLSASVDPVNAALVFVSVVVLMAFTHISRSRDHIMYIASHLQRPVQINGDENYDSRPHPNNFG